MACGHGMPRSDMNAAAVIECGLVRDSGSSMLGGPLQSTHQIATTDRTHAGQTIFSLSLAQGIMTAYGSYAPDSTDVPIDSLVIAGSNILVELLAGFAVFSTLGNMVRRPALKQIAA
jgi:Sodium:neurotransmitter symporter family